MYVNYIMNEKRNNKNYINENESQLVSDMINHINKINELNFQFDCKFCDTQFEDIKKEDLIQLALDTIELFNEKGTLLNDAIKGYSNFNDDFKADKDLKKQYNQIKYFIKKWN